MMEWEAGEKELKAAGAEPLGDGRHGLRIRGWEIESYKGSILKSLHREEYVPAFALCFFFLFIILHKFPLEKMELIASCPSNSYKSALTGVGIILGV